MKGEVVKSYSVIDGNLVIHYGLSHIPQTRFIVIDKALALQLSKLIKDYLSC